MITFKNENGVTKTVKNGFSWTTLFFGCFVPLIRGDVKWFLISILAAFITLGFSWLVFPFFYNKLYINDLKNAGYRVIRVI